MIVLVDTPVWSLSLRRKQGSLSHSERMITEQLKELIREGRAQILGPIRQELLSGIRTEEQFGRLRDDLSAFPEPVLDRHDYEEAAYAHNLCQRRGIAGSAVDFLICAVARRRNWLIFSLDRDFRRYAAVLSLRLYRSAGDQHETS